MGMRSFGLKHALLMGAATLGLGMGAAVLSPAYAQETTRSYDIPAQDLDDALREFGRQTGRDVLFTPGAVAGKRSPGVRGQMTERQALEALLAGSGLRIAQTASNGYAVQDPASPTQLGGADFNEPAEEEVIVVTGSRIPGTPVGRNLVVIDREAIDRTGQTTVQGIVQTLPQNFVGGGANESTALGGGPTNLNTSNGSSVNLRGLGPGATLVLLNGRRIAPSGSDGSVVDIASLPASAVDRVEVLLDGASAIYGADAVGGVVNIILRRDYDGAETRASIGIPTQGDAEEYSIGQTFGTQWSSGSAIFAYDYYRRNDLPASERDSTADQDLRSRGGSDFRDRFSNPGTIVIGAQTWAIPAGQDGTALTPSSFVAGTRNFSNANDFRDYLPDQERNSAFASIRQELGSHVELSADLLGSWRNSLTTNGNISIPITVPNTNAFYVNPTGGTGPIGVDYNFSRDIGPSITDIDVETFSGGLGATVQLFGDWELLLRGDHSQETVTQLSSNQIIFSQLFAALADSNPATAFNPFGDGSFTNPATLNSIRGTTSFSSESELSSATIGLSGSLFELPAGPIATAVGFEYREQSFGTASQSTAGSTAVTAAERDRQIDAGYLEFRVPIFGAQNALPLLRALDFSVAARYDSYSDFGSATTPAFALSWSPVEDLTFRASRTESFTAPTLPRLNETNNLLFITSIPDPSSGSGSTAVLFQIGNGNADLEPERSQTWTLGADYQPETIDGLTVSLTYFETEYENKIQHFAAQAFSFLQDPRFASFVTRNPTLDQRTEACSGGRFLGPPANCTTAPIGAIVDVRPNNAATTNLRGIDFTASYTFDVAGGSAQLSLNAAHLIELSEALTPTAPTADILDVQFQPADLRLRGSAFWTRDSWTLGSTVTYTDEYTDTLSNPDREISSWTGVDLQARYDGQEGGQFDGVAVTLNVFNVFDEEPAFFNNSVGIAYDPTNTAVSAVVGRTVSLQVRKAW